MRIGVLKHGEDNWKRTFNHNKYHPFKLSTGPPVYDNGILYFLDVKGNAGGFNTREHGTPLAWGVFKKCLKQRRLRRNIKEHYLINPKGERELFAVFARHDNREVRIFRLSNEFLWELVESIGDRVFYVSKTSSFGFRTNVKSIMNKIFFPKLHGENVVCYSLDTQRYHSFEADYSSADVQDLKFLNFATWVVPTLTEPQVLSEESMVWCPQVDQAST